MGFTKSAQVPFSSWLPAAILAPTPVSALVHSSTLVTAGVYLLYRYSPADSLLLICIGLCTTLIAGQSALLECDTKKIIALSTLSQLGVMVTCLGLGERSFCFAHLNTHAAFKALLFLGVGTVIHSTYGSQEVRCVVPLFSCSPFVIVILVTSVSSMLGLVFLSGWATKEAILESCLNMGVCFFGLVLFYVGIGFTVIYRLRLCVLLFQSQGTIILFSPSISCPWPVKFPIFCLIRLSIVEGTIFNFNCSSYPVNIRCYDKIVVLGVLLTSVFCGLMLSSTPILQRAPLAYLSIATYVIRHQATTTSKFNYTEVSALHGLGLGNMPSLTGFTSFGTVFCGKIFIAFIFIFILT